MIKNNLLLSKVDNDFENLKNRIDIIEFENNKKLLSDDNYSDIYYKYNAAMFLCEKEKFLNNDTSKIEKECETLYNKLLKLKEAFKPIIVNYNCNNCNDSGYDLSGKRCHCFYEKLTNEAYNYLSISKPKLYSFSQDTMSNLCGKTELYNKLKHYSKCFSTNSKNLIFSGKTGTGKTFLASAIANEICKLNFNVIYLTAVELNKSLLAWHIANINDKFIFSDIFTTCDLLVIDDLGTEPILSNVTVEYLYNIIAERNINNKPFIITTNLSQNNLLERYGDRIYSRLQAKNTIKIDFDGIDLRK